MLDGDPVIALSLRLGLLSLVAVGGLHPLLPALHRFMVTDNGWLTDAGFTSLYALAQAAPGPNVVFVTLLGWHLTGIVGALVATAAIVLPSSLLAYGFARVWMTWGKLGWFEIVQRGLLPVSVGLIAASGLLVTDAAARGWTGYLLAAGVALIVLRTKLHPFWMLAAGGMLGLLGLV